MLLFARGKRIRYEKVYSKVKEKKEREKEARFLLMRICC
jgi:hypothetical protein